MRVQAWLDSHGRGWMRIVVEQFLACWRTSGDDLRASSRSLM